MNTLKPLVEIFKDKKAMKQVFRFYFPDLKYKYDRCYMKPVANCAIMTGTFRRDRGGDIKCRITFDLLPSSPKRPGFKDLVRSLGYDAL